MTAPLHTERTPLLNSNSRNRHPSPAESPNTEYSPAIEPYVARLLSEGSSLDDHWHPDSFDTEADQTAFTILVLLRSKASADTTRITADIWEQWSAEVKNTTSALAVDERIVKVWNTFVDVPRTTTEVEGVFWRRFPLYEGGSSPLIRVIDLHGFLPKELLTHRVLELSLVQTWKHGLSHMSKADNLLTRLMQRLKMVLTPRLLHSIDLLGLFSYLAILVRYSLDPPTAEAEYVAQFTILRTVLLASYCCARTLREWSVENVPYILIAISLLSALPTGPRATDTAYDVVLLALSIHLLVLHLPKPPSPLYVFPFQQVLPLTMLVSNGASKIYLPVLALFLPVLLVVAFLLFSSLADNPLDVSRLTAASPLEARSAFFILLIILLLLLICSVAMLILVYPLISSNAPASAWDRYSVSLGIDARRTFIRTVLTYTYPHGSSVHHPLYRSFPPSEHISKVLNALQRALWWVSVGPLALSLVATLICEVVFVNI